jgi:primosomal protein N'
MYILEIIPLQKGIPRDTLSYFSMREIPLGAIVEIPFRSNTITGIVINSLSARDIKTNLRSSSFSLKPVGSIIHDQSFPAPILRGLQEISENTLVPMGTLVSTFFPDNVLEHYLEWKPMESISDIRIIELPEKKRFDYYVVLAKESLAKSHSIIFVAPTTIQIEKIVAACADHFEKTDIVYLSGSIKPEKREAIYEQLKTTREPKIICVTPGFFILPTDMVRSCVIDSYHSNYYVQDFGQRFDYRFIITKLAKIFGYSQYYADSIHSPEFSELIETRKAYLDRGTVRADSQVPISVVQKETKNEPLYISPFFASRTISLIKKKLADNVPIFIFAGRKSIATATVCNDCNYTVTCPNCTAVMHLVKKNPLSESDNPTQAGRMFVCNRCETEIPPMNRCPHCLGWNLIPLGVTIESIHDELQKIFPDANLFKSTQDITKTESACKKLVTTWNKNGGILIGTQKIIPYIDQVPISIVASYDQCISVPDYRTMFQAVYLFQAIYEKTAERMIIQSRDAMQEFLIDYAQQNIDKIIKNEEALRTEYHFPPSYILITVTMSDIARRDHMRAKDFLKRPFAPFEHSIQSQFFEQSQMYEITGKIHIKKQTWIDKGSEIKHLIQFMQTMRSDADIQILGI